MNIQLSHMQAHNLGRAFAETIHSEIIRRRLIRIGIGYPGPNSDFQAVRAAIASIPDKFERWSFIATVKYYLHLIMANKGTVPCWQDYVAKVEAINNAYCSNRPKAYLCARP